MEQGKGKRKGKGKGKGNGHCFTWQNFGECWKHQQGMCDWKHDENQRGIQVRPHSTNNIYKRNYEINNIFCTRNREATQRQECTPIKPGKETAMEDSEWGTKTKRAISSKAHKTSNQLKYLRRPSQKNAFYFLSNIQ